ncbi:D-3-phosphoglycerate dehydrogenase [Lactococcus lactis subsp. lactis]|uniref:D-3-phosphoglycerate dehydrogenase n=1 Tax=Lactococcus lactis subsp. lactis TaxID=1360 RepID=A0A0V8EAE4_LACLL|nr:D-3-phosphoglycerate dehydrogenase [Lactococcus lactis subsp. lactis]
MLLSLKKLAGAGIDVTDPEPLPKGHRAWHTERLLITPHASGGYTLPETWRRFMKILEKNLDAYANGKELTNIVDMKTGYKRNAHK